MVCILGIGNLEPFLGIGYKSPFLQVCRTNFLAQFLFPFSGNPCKVFCTVIAIRLRDDMRVLGGRSAVVNPLVVCRQGTSCWTSLQSEVVSSTCGKGVPLFIGLP